MGFYIVFVCIYLISIQNTCLGTENTTICSKHERLALLKFKQSVIDESRMMSSWVGNECCWWEGVRCDAATGNIVSLSLRGNTQGSYYSGPLSNYIDREDVGEHSYLVGDEVQSSLADLRRLKYLDLSGNKFEGARIPHFIGSFKQLSYLNLSNGGFHGIIPHHIRNLSKLKVLDLSSWQYPRLTVKDITWIFRLSLLEHLDLSGADLSGAQNWYKVLYMVPSLRKLSLSRCMLYNAKLSLSLNSSRAYSSIEHLDISSNFFNGRPPIFLRNITSLTFLDLSNSDLGLAWNLVDLLRFIPSLLELHLSNCQLLNNHLYPTRFNFSTRFNIQHLDLGTNSFEGRFPPLFKNMTSLKFLDLYGNYLNSSVPIMPNLLTLDISYNKFKHISHVGIWRQCNLKQLSVSSNLMEEEMIDQSTNMSICSQYALERLYLDRNQLNGSIPESIGRLTNLRVLDLSRNKLTNLIPEALGRLRSLKVLDISLNQIKGPIPTSLGRLASLQVLAVHTNLLTGEIPVSIGQLLKVKFLDFSSNYLEGTFFNAHLTNLSELKHLIISSRSILKFNVSHDWIPPFQLNVLSLSSCKIENGFPQWLKNQRNLKMLVLSNASMSGPPPSWLSKIPITGDINLSHNKLTGLLANLPLGHSPFKRFRDEYRGSELLLQNNLFSGSIPRSLCRTNLEFLDLSGNMLTGEIPNCVQKLKKLIGMVFSSNRLSGVIPSSIGQMSSLSWLHLNDNNFNGELPQSLRNLQDLNVLDVSNNKLSGKIPEWIAELVELNALRLHKNNFTGGIPRSLCTIFCLQILDVAHNRLKGSIPTCFRELPGMIENHNDYCGRYTYRGESMVQVLKGDAYEYTTTLKLLVNLDLSSNELDGRIPEMNLTKLLGLNLSHNHLSGSIPSSIGNMKALISLDLSGNKLTGMIPPSMADLTFLSHLNFSHNNLSGRIPSGNQLQTFTDLSIYSYNEYLCGFPLPKSCSNHKDPTTTTRKNKLEAADEPKKLWFYLDIMCGFATGFWGIIGVLLFKKSWRHNIFRFAEITIDRISMAGAAARVAR
ncbi:receptor-like protein EIX2 [Bidens hawaiensis]|uniref:receptor-like protein EIX2 n=1 Tax=Bidens hawaiensis TaxID=980011 RepID=UPI00404AF644